MKSVPIVPQPRLNFRPVMVGSIVVNQKDLLATVAVGQAVEKSCVSLAIEHRFSLNEVNLWPANIHRPENLLGVALARRGNQRLAPTPSPSLIQSGVLTKTGLIGEEQSGAQISGFFLASDRCSAANDPATADPLWPNACVDAEPKIPKP